MHGERASLGSSSANLNFEHGSTSSNVVTERQFRWEDIHNLNLDDLPNYLNSATDTYTTFPNSVYHEQCDLHSFSLGEASSSSASSHSGQWMEIGRFEEQSNGKLELNPMFVPPSNEIRAIRNVNMNAEYNEHLEDMDLPGLRSSVLPENSVRADAFVDGCCKRKVLDERIDESSSNRGFREFQRGESSSWVPTPSFYSPANDLNISLDYGPRVLASGVCLLLLSPRAPVETSLSGFKKL